MSDSDLMELYSRRILALASDIAHLGRLPDPTGSAHRRAPQCGSSVTVDVRMAEDRAREIVSEAKRSATSLREGADDYVASSLDELARLIADVSRRTEAGRRTIAERRGVDVTDVDLSHE